MEKPGIINMLRSKYKNPIQIIYSWKRECHENNYKVPNISILIIIVKFNAKVTRGNAKTNNN